MRRGESGQSVLEAAIVMPAITLLLIWIFQIGWIVYTGGCLSSAVAHAQYMVTPREAAAGNLNEVLRAHMIEASPVLASGELTVSGARMDTRATSVGTYILSDDDYDRYRIGTKNEWMERAQVSATVVYVPESIFGIGLTPRYTRVVDASRIVSETFELA